MKKENVISKNKYLSMAKGDMYFKKIIICEDVFKIEVEI